MEGTHLPGVSYPETLSTNLTSKRTSHKIAEQGRRNRINLALQEIASLLPPTLATANGTTSNGSKSSGGEGKEGSENGKSAQQTAAQQSNSKASTVEMAIDYIKDLRGEVQDLKAKMVILEKELAEKNKEG